MVSKWLPWGVNGMQKRVVRRDPFPPRYIWYVSCGWFTDPIPYYAHVFEQGRHLPEHDSPPFDSITAAMQWADARALPKPAKILVGYRVRSSDPGHYVYRDHRGGVAADSVKGKLLSCSEAHRLLADWLDCGYNGQVVRVVVA